MEVNVLYSDFLNQDNKKEISKVSVKLDASKSLEFDIVKPVLETDKTTCKIKMSDESTVSQVESIVNKEDFMELIAVIREVAAQL